MYPDTFPVKAATSYAEYDDWQKDFVSILTEYAGYSVMTLTTITDGGAALRCATPDGTSYVEYQFTASDKYQHVGNVYCSGAINAAYQVVRTKLFSRITLGNGVYNNVGASIVIWTPTVGATWSIPIMTTSPNALVTVKTFKDNRGGLWRLSIAEIPGLTFDMSVYDIGTGVTTNSDTLVIPNAGKYTLVGTFMGQDPANPVGSPRGWLQDPDPDSTFITINEKNIPDKVMVSPLSNKDFAITCRPSGVGATAQFIPYHGDNTERVVSRAYYIDGKSVQLNRYEYGEPVTINDFKLKQVIRGTNTTWAGGDSAAIETTWTLAPSGKLSVDGTFTTLVDMDFTSAAYVMMLPLWFAAGFNKVLNSRGGEYAIVPDTGSGSNVTVNEGDTSRSYAAVGTGSFVAANAFRNRRDTLRVGAAGKGAIGTRAFIEQRAGGDMAKIYPRAYENGMTIKKGVTHKFSGDMFYGVVPNAYAILKS